MGSRSRLCKGGGGARPSSVSPRARSSPRPPLEDKDENGSGGETRQILRQRVELPPVPTQKHRDCSGSSEHLFLRTEPVEREKRSAVERAVDYGSSELKPNRACRFRRGGRDRVLVQAPHQNRIASSALPPPSPGSAAMDPRPACRATPRLQQLACVFLIMMTSLPASALESETCFSRQHRGATVTLQPALNRTAAATMDARLVHSERDCVLACCSEEVRPGVRCNMVLFNGKKPAGEENCFLFHCDGEQDCPLMKAQDGVNTYNIYKGLIHPPTPRPVTMTTATANTFPLTTTLLPTTTTAPTTTTTATTTVMPTTTTQAPITTTTAPPPVILATAPTVTAPPATTTKTTTTPAASPAPAFTSKRPNKASRKQNKSTKKGKSHGASAQPQPSFTTSLPVPTEVKGAPQRTADTPEPQAESTTTGSTTATTASTTDPPPTTTPTPTTTTTTVSLSNMESSTTRATPLAGLIIVPKEAIQANRVLQNSSPAHGKTSGVHGALKSGMVAFMVVALAVVTLALAVGGRKAMESFDRRHYTRLELNDLHYEV